MTVSHRPFFAGLSKPVEGQPYQNPVAHALVIGGLSRLAHMAYRVSYRNLEHLAQESAFILAPTHQRMLDIPLTGRALLQGTGRRALYIMKEELLHTRFGSLLHAAGGLPIARGGSTLVDATDGDQMTVAYDNSQSFEHAGTALRAGSPLVVYMQGTRYKDIMGPINPVAVKHWLRQSIDVAQQRDQDVPIIPLGISYQNSSSPGSTITIAAGPALKPGDMRATTYALHLALATLSGCYPLEEQRRPAVDIAERGEHFVNPHVEQELMEWASMEPYGSASNRGPAPECIALLTDHCDYTESRALVRRVVAPSTHDAALEQLVLSASLSSFADGLAPEGKDNDLRRAYSRTSARLAAVMHRETN